MKYLYPLIILFLVSCKISKTNKDPLKNVWTIQDDKVTDSETLLPKAYSTYLLNKHAFSKQLVAGLIQLPQTNKSFAFFEVENSNTMSNALQEKFPQLRSYKGMQQNNPLCQCRIDQNELDFKITILCNDATYYVNDLYENGIYFFYNKQDLPVGVGQINE